MANMDAFNSSAFSMTSLTGAVEKMDYVPSLLGSLGIFEPMPVRTRDVWVERKDGVLSLVQTSAIGAPPAELAVDLRDATPFRTVRLAKGFTLYAEEVQNIRAFGTESEMEQVMGEYLKRLAKVRSEIELTHEKHRLSALQGILLDADDSVIYNYFTEFGESQASAVSFELDVTTTNVRTLCHGITRSMARLMKGRFTTGTAVHALCGDQFYDALIDHANVRDSYIRWSDAPKLRENIAWEAFEYGGITFHNYRGTDDASTVAVATTEAKFFPVGAPGFFKRAQSPAEFGPFVNTPGMETYALNIPDRDRQAWTRGEIYSYPLYICTQPEALQRATLT